MARDAIHVLDGSNDSEFRQVTGTFDDTKINLDTVVNASALPAGAATETTLSTLLARQLLLSDSGVQDTITVTTAAIEAKVGATALAGRKLITIQPKGNGIYWGRNSGLDTSNGTELHKDQTLAINADETAPIYLIAASGTIDVRITESA